jgi:hypothetical protein
MSEVRTWNGKLVGTVDSQTNTLHIRDGKKIAVIAVYKDCIIVRLTSALSVTEIVFTLSFAQASTLSNERVITIMPNADFKELSINHEINHQLPDLFSSPTNVILNERARITIGPLKLSQKLYNGLSFQKHINSSSLRVSPISFK